MLLALTLRGTRACSFLTAVSSLQIQPLCKETLLKQNCGAGQVSQGEGFFSSCLHILGRLYLQGPA